MVKSWIKIGKIAKNKLTTIAFPSKDLIGWEYIDEQENIIEISFLPLALTNGWGCK